MDVYIDQETHDKVVAALDKCGWVETANGIFLSPYGTKSTKNFFSIRGAVAVETRRYQQRQAQEAKEPQTTVENTSDRQSD